jgi:hypothetical protein
MIKFWKFVVFVCLVVQTGNAYNTNKQNSFSLQKETENIFSKKSFSPFQFVRPTINRATSDFKTNYRIPTALGHPPLELTSLSVLDKYQFNLISAKQDINRCTNVSDLLFPFHYYW